MSVLEAFVHDPLTEFASSNSDKRRNKADRGDEAERLTRTARTNLKPILAKLTGLRTTHRGDESGTVAASTEAQVESLIKEAMDPTNLVRSFLLPAESNRADQCTGGHVRRVDTVYCAF